MKTALIAGARSNYLFILLAGTILSLSACQSSSKTLFKKITVDKSGIHFNNAVTENDTVNPIDLEYLYNGGGVAVGDFNNDGLPDLYFTGSMVPNKLYLNKGSLSFQDVTDESNTAGEGEWFNAASVVDINNDGLEDIYLCATIKSNPAQRRNLLYINQGLDNKKVPIFKEMAAEYGLADTSLSVHAAFFDYDNDGDLDMYLLTTKLARRDAATFINRDTSNSDFDKLYRNDWNDSLKHPVYTDVSKQAGIQQKGMGLGVAVADINKDGWKDVYVTNDFYGSDLLYINNKNGTFTEEAKKYFKHTSQNAMGNDVADIN
ncbi:MAG TPA: VCBS repeat-containing protein, partial [Chitinophagaceae bacterium]|nr:VCBS repeat-containing protein [Chitinophagaceae bacterium]